jgi:lipocalin
MLINGHRVEIKFSTLWKTGIYRFQQLRDQNYEYSVCLGISPFEAHCWVISKSILKQYVIGHMGQHTGSSGQETALLPVKPHKPPEWLAPYGGALDQAFSVLKSLSPRK